MAAATGPPNRAEIAENVPAVESTLPSASPTPREARGRRGRRPSRERRAAPPGRARRRTPASRSPRVRPPERARSGSVRPRSHRAARGRRRREATCGPRERSQRRRAAGRRRGTTAVPTAPRWSGRSTQNQCSSSWTAARKSAAASAAGIPMRAPRPTRRRARPPDMGAPVSGELTRGRAPPRRTRSARTEAPGIALGSAPAAPPAAPGRAGRRTRPRARRRA